jgi:ABC-type multidrug transport system fused ATPase/permease subunit
MYNDVLKTFFKKNKLIMIVFFLIAAIVLPIEAIGTSKYASKIILLIKDKNNFDKIYKYLFIILIIYTITRVLNTIQYYLEILLDTNLVEEIRNGMFKEVLDKYKDKYQEVEVGKIISYFNVIPDIYRDLIYRTLRFVFPYSFAIFTLIIYYYVFVDIKIAITITVYLLIVGFFIYKIGKKCIKYNIEKHQHYHEINENIQDKLANVFSIIVNNKDNEEKNKNIVNEKEHKKKRIKSEFFNLKLDTLLNIITIIFYYIILFCYVPLFQLTKKNPHIITSFLIFFYLITYIDNVKWYIIDMFNGIGILNNYDQMLKENITNMNKGTKKGFIKQGKIQFKNVSFSYNNKIIHNNLNIIFYPSKINTIIGKSGSGKTTILKLILGLNKPTKGEILIDGVNSKNIDLNYLRSNISIVSQDIKLFNNSIYYNISYGNNITNKKIKELVLQLGLFNTIFKNLKNGLDTGVGVNGTHLSNGQRQMVLILRVYLQNKKIFILDEPTTALDPKSKSLILGIIKKISINKNTIIVTHDNDVKHISNHIHQL